MIEVLITILIILLVVFVLFSLSGQKKETQHEMENLYTTALNHMLNNENKAAIKCFREIVRKDTENIDAYIKLGILMRRNGKTASALNIHNNLLYRSGIGNVQQFEILRNLIEDYIQLGDKHKALSTAEKILDLDKENIWALEKLQFIYRDLGQWDKASEYLEKVLLLRKEKNDRLLSLYKVQEGLTKYDQGLYHEARLLFRQAIKIDPSCEAAYYYIADSYVKDKREIDAIEWWDKFAEIAPERVHIIFSQIQKVLFDLGNFGKIEGFYENILRRKPGDIRTITALAGFYERKGNIGKAFSLIEDLREKNPESKVVKMALCKLLILQERYAEASEILNEYVDSFEEPDEFVCSNCGHKEKKILWLCPECGQPDTYLNRS